MIGSRGGKRLLWGGLVLLAMMLAAPVCLEALGRALIADDPLHPANAILVLSGESREGNRVQRAVDLYKQGLAPLLVLSGAPVGFRTHETEITQRHAEYLGVPSNHILTVKHDADSTKQEAEAVVPILKAKGLKEVILVTSNYHTARAKRIFAKAAGPAGPRFLASPTDDGLFDPDGWWTRRRHAKTFFYEAIRTVWSALEAE